MVWKLAIAGLGAAARNIHLPAYKRIVGLKVVGGVDPCAKSGDFDASGDWAVDKDVKKALDHEHV